MNLSIASMAIQAFSPKFMKVCVLTAALQELTPRGVRDADPDRAIEEWLAFARELGASDIQLSAAQHPTETGVPADAMLDPVANTLDLRQPFDRNRARRVEAAQKTSGVGLSDVACFDNMLHHDPAVRQKKHDLDAARLRRCGVAGRRRGLRLRVAQPATQHGREPD
jgi:sugar phosphate isomerase/epimerase